MSPSFTVRTLSRDDILLHLNDLTDILINCVEGGASVSFILPFSRDKARAFWQRTAASVAANERILLAALNPQQRIVGTVQLIIDQPENQPHRADVAKLLVHEDVRRFGIASQLMAHLETVARDTGKNVLVLDTASGSGAETFYQRAGWQKVGEIPRYALMPAGELTATSVFYKFL
ncbi:GNAT family N-acetyltransferase [Pseudocitrobacter sp. 73]|uniref:GNAT family N-acetyltransferase n=1 Tax=Pseudocitrobacter sp. 73 TaxID=2605731 RepID=UPI0011EFB978|nr:GNAT family N-acetyltransferase [Pseudocitrobacter sp. 73]KAA1048867.1 GNAT family N-acetyltransferase [Pseudocitrobacter sp. 73]